MFPEWQVWIEPFMIFTKGEDEFVDCLESLDEEQVKTHTIHPPDIWIIREDGKSLILELDGPIHDTKRTEKTAKRNKLFELNDLDYIVVNEQDLKFELGLAKSADLTQDQINAAFVGQIKQL